MLSSLRAKLRSKLEGPCSLYNTTTTAQILLRFGLYEAFLEGSRSFFLQGEGYRRRRSSGGERAGFLEEESEPRK